MSFSLFLCFFGFFFFLRQCSFIPSDHSFPIIFALITVFYSDILGGSCQSPSQDEQAESGLSVHKNSVTFQQIETVSRVCVMFQEI